MTLKHWTGRGAPGVLIMLLAAGSAWAQQQNPAGTTPAMLHVSSTSFVDGQKMPQKLTCDGSDVSPGMQWSTAPAGTQSYAIVMNDPDAPGGFTHWLAYNIPASIRDLPEGASTPTQRLAHAVEGANDFGHAGYGGPCPPEGNPHHYVFEVYALDSHPRLPAGASQEQLIMAIRGHVLAHGQMTGLYARGGG